MKEILKEFISHQIRSNCFENIPLTTKRIKECYQGASNSKIFDELWMLENLGIICIKQAARSNKLFNNRKNWIKRKQSICRYVIDILKPEYFDVATVSETDWAIKAFVDTEKWDFVLQFNGIDEDIRIDLKPRKGNEKSLLMYFGNELKIMQMNGVNVVVTIKMKTKINICLRILVHRLMHFLNAFVKS